MQRRLPASEFLKCHQLPNGAILILDTRLTPHTDLTQTHPPDVLRGACRKSDTVRPLFTCELRDDPHATCKFPANFTGVKKIELGVRVGRAHEAARGSAR